MTYILLLSFHWSELITWSPSVCREVGKYIGAQEYTVSKMISATLYHMSYENVSSIYVHGFKNNLS